jgi:Rps23 Pro-64 3,4-dihydroxylase Tpa1-like proline 4-hydroxylase
MIDKLLENNYIIIPNFISRNSASLLGKEFKNYCKNNNIPADAQVLDSSSKYDYISFLELLCEKTSEISSILGETVLPTYSYARVYNNGSVLEPHCDRDACEISLTVHLYGDSVWPIFIETPNKEERSVILNPGDAMLYLACESKHWRDIYFGEEYVQVFLHYVRSRGDKSYAYFDKPMESNLDDAKKTLALQKEENDITVVNQKSSVVKNDLDEYENKNLSINENNVNTLKIESKSNATLDSFIHVFDDIIPEVVCDQILEEYENCHNWEESVISSGKDPTIRNCSQIIISNHNIISENTFKRQNIDNSIFQSVSKVIIEYKKIHPLFEVNVDTGYQLLRYNEQQFYTEHTDSFIEQQRALSCSIQLNEDYDGGEFAFFDREIMIRSKKGSAIVFPSNFMYPHEIMPVIRGTRYSVITWLV